VYSVQGSAIQLSWYTDVADYPIAHNARGQERGARIRAVALMAIAVAVTALGAFVELPLLLGIGATLFVAGLLLVALGQARTGDPWPVHPTLGTAVHAEVDPDSGLTIWAHRATGVSVHHCTDHFPWSSIRRVRETERVFLVQLRGKLPCVLIAKRGLADQRDLALLRSLLFSAVRPEGHN
jgi:hypothetical protein